MCLITPNKEIKIADEDITVYKVLTTDLKAIFRKTQYEIGVLNETIIEESTDWNVTGAKDVTWINDNYKNRLYAKKSGDFICLGQGFHSCLLFEDAKEINQELNESSIILECTIPKGAEYYDSPFDYLVSNKIILNKIM